MLSVILLLSFFSPLPQELFAQEYPIKFKWAVIYGDSTKEPGIVNYKRKYILGKDAKIRFYMKPYTDLFVYLFYVSPDNKVETLLSNKLGVMDEELFLPDEYSWYQFDEARGMEKFILVVSSSRIKPIDKLISISFSNKAEFSSKIMDEIKRQRQMHSSFASEQLRPIEMAGVARGIPNKRDAKVIQADTFYSKTYRFEHK